MLLPKVVSNAVPNAVPNEQYTVFVLAIAALSLTIAIGIDVAAVDGIAALVTSLGVLVSSLIVPLFITDVSFLCVILTVLLVSCDAVFVFVVAVFVVAVFVVAVFVVAVFVFVVDVFVFVVVDVVFDVVLPVHGFILSILLITSN